MTLLSVPILCFLYRMGEKTKSTMTQKKSTSSTRRTNSIMVGECFVKSCNLSVLQGRAGSEEKRIHAARLVKILEMDYTLAKRKLSFRDKAACTPLAILIAADVGLRPIQDLVRRHGKKLLRGHHDDDSNTALHIACRYASTEVVQYILTKESTSARMTNSRRQYPFHCALLNPKHMTASPEIWTKLLQPCISANTRTLEEVEDAETLWQVTWQSALAMNHPRALSILTNRIPEEINTLDLDVQDFENPMTLIKTEALLDLLRAPQLNLVRFKHWYAWGYDDFAHFLISLETISTVSSLESIILPDLSSIECPSLLLERLAHLLKYNKSLKHLSFKLNHYDPAIWALWVGAFERGLSDNRTLKQVRFDQYFSVKTNDELLSRIDWQVDSTSRRRVRLCTAALALEDPGFIQHLSAVPKLDELVLRLNTESTAPLILHAVKEAVIIHPSLQKLKVINAYKAYDWVGSASTQLVSFFLNMLEHRNTTLEVLSPWSEFHPSIQYWLDLNRVGRGKVLQSVGSGRTNEVMAALEAIKSSKGFSRERQLCLRYKMLRETPDLWCTLPQAASF